MNVLIAGGFWAIAKFMVLLCCTIVSMIKAIYFYVNTVKKWKRLTKTLYVMTVVPFFASLIITLGGVSNIIKGDWVIKVFSVVIFGGFMGGWYVKSLLKEEGMHFSKMEIEKYKFLIKSFLGSSIALLVMALIIYL
ncbi:hypothetical protein [Dialister invisus]|uniref:hypothetical protein n=1 Tax=Dialister invisus TaxID=218538 RepID=UPI00267657E1|nr:hypothetical protein [Dialister invisus]